MSLSLERSISTGFMEDDTTVRYKQNAAISFGFLLVATALMALPNYFDRPLTVLFNKLAGKSKSIDLFFYNLDNRFVFSGVILMAVIWGAWFKERDDEIRGRIIVGVAASLFSSLVSRLMQLKISSHPRPFYDPAIDFRAPFDVPFNSWNSFPSDHVAIFAGLAVVIWLAKSRLRIPITLWLVVVESARTYVGAHYPSDLLGGAALGALVVWLSQNPWMVERGRRFAQLASFAPSVFYMVAYLISYQIATIVIEMRQITSGVFVSTTGDKQRELSGKIKPVAVHQAGIR